MFTVASPSATKINVGARLAGDISNYTIARKAGSYRGVCQVLGAGLDDAGAGY